MTMRDQRLSLNGLMQNGGNLAVISCLPKFNSIVEGIDCSDRSSINKAVNDFSITMRSVADTFF